MGAVITMVIFLALATPTFRVFQYLTGHVSGVIVFLPYGCVMIFAICVFGYLYAPIERAD